LLAERELLERVAVLGRTAAAHRESPGDFAHVEVVLRVERETVRRREAARRFDLGRTPACEHLAVLVVDAHARLPELLRSLAGAIVVVALVPRQLGHVDVAQLVEGDVRRALGVRPLTEVLAVRAEDLNAVGFAIAHPYAAVCRACNAVWQAELAGAVAGLSPR